MVMRLRKGETVFSSAGELVVTHQVLDDEPILCVSIPAVEDSEGRLDREHVTRLRDSLNAWLEMVK